MDNFAKDDGLLSKILDTGKKAALAEGVSSHLGFPGAGTAGVMASLFNKQKPDIAKAAGDLLASPRLQGALNAYARAGGAANAAVTAQEKRLMRTVAYKKWFGALADTSKARVAALGPIQYLTGAGTTASSPQAAGAHSAGSGFKTRMAANAALRQAGLNDGYEPYQTGAGGWVIRIKP